MQHAAKHLEGTHDFTSYRAVACQAKSPIRKVHKIALSQHNEYITYRYSRKWFFAPYGKKYSRSFNRDWQE